MRLKHITFTGIDAKTDIQDLIDIQREFPIAEFGVLTSYHWYENGNRYLNPQFLHALTGRELNLALHICGSMAIHAADGCWEAINKHTEGCLVLGLFQRVQLNVANRQDIPPSLCCTPDSKTEVIIQQQPGHDGFYKNSRHARSVRQLISMLIDGSGGQGIDSPISIYPSPYKVGYAGGFNPDNVAEKLSFLLQNVRMGEFWIDMESGVRTDDWFDTDKVRRVLRICKEVIRDLGVED